MTNFNPIPAKPRHTGRTVAITIAAVLAVICIGGGIAALLAGGDNTTTTTTPPAGPPAAATPAGGTGTASTTKPAAGATTITGDGTYLVPSEVKPGTYRATVPDGSILCYWARLKSIDTTDILENGTGESGARMTARIRTTDKAFETRDCGTWTKIG